MGSLLDLQPCSSGEVGASPISQRAFLWSAPPRRSRDPSFPWGQVSLREEASFLRCSPGGAWSQDGKGHREWIFPSKEWRVTFGIRLSTAEQAVQMQSDLLGNVRLGHTCLASCAGGFVRLHIPRRRTSSPQPGPGGALESCCSFGESHWGPTDSRHSSRLHRAVALGILTCSITSRSEFWTQLLNSSDVARWHNPVFKLCITIFSGFCTFSERPP